MPQSDAQPTDTVVATSMPAVDLMADGVNPRKPRSTGLSSIRQWKLWASLALAVTLGVSGAVVLASQGDGSSSAAAGGNAVARSEAGSDAASATSNAAHRHSPIRRTSPHAR